MIPQQFRLQSLAWWLALRCKLEAETPIPVWAAEALQHADWEEGMEIWRWRRKHGRC